MLRKTPIIIAIMVVFLAGGAGYFAFTPSGSRILVTAAISRYTHARHITFSRVNGSLARQLSLYDLKVSDSLLFPQGLSVEAQRIDAYFSLGWPVKLNLAVFNGKVRLPDSGEILFYGKMHGEIMDFNLYSKKVALRPILDLVRGNSTLKKISGDIVDADIYLRGQVFSPEIQGKLRLDKLVYAEFSLLDCPVSFGINLRGAGNIQLHGEVLLNGGVASGQRTASVKIQSSRLIFSGDPYNLRMDLNGISEVAGEKIDVKLKGNLDKPELVLSSAPPQAQEKLLIMLLTNAKWSGSFQEFKDGVIPLDIVKDSLDYFLFSGSLGRLSKQLGVDVSVKYDGLMQGVGIKKNVSSKIDAQYQIEQSLPAPGGNAPDTLTQTIGGEYKVTDTLSIGAERQTKQEVKKDNNEPVPLSEKIMLKLKKNF